MANPAHVAGHGLARPSFSAKSKLEFRRKLGSAQKELLHTTFTIGQAIPHKHQIASQSWARLYRMMRLRIKPVIDRMASCRAQTLVMLYNGRATAIGENQVVLRNHAPEWIAW